MKQKVLILGAGFGGLELASRLTERLRDQVQVTLIDKSDFFILGYAKLEVLFGKKKPEEIKSYYKNLSSSIDFRMEEILSIDPERCIVHTNASIYEAEILVIALGADLKIDATPGLAQHGYEFYSLPGVERLAPVLRQFQSGIALISVLGMPYKCPPAPFETALRLHDYLTSRGIRKNVSIRVSSPTPSLLPISKEGSQTILRLFQEREIEFLPGHAVTSIDGTSKQVNVKDRDPLPYDLLMAVPVHTVPRVVADSGLAQGGWVPVNIKNLETRFKNVYAIGDVTKIPVGSGAVPKAGAFADRGAQTVADEIIYRITGAGSPGHFDGRGTCFLEFGDGAVAKVEANFLGGPTPEVRFIGPSHEFLPDKEEFGSNRTKRWFVK
jgi:sulfide:quinone oxidoreductase